MIAASAAKPDAPTQPPAPPGSGRPRAGLRRGKTGARLYRQSPERCGGNKTKAARLLQISERTLWYKLKKYAIN